jgi:hypothetical protein
MLSTIREVEEALGDGQAGSPDFLRLRIALRAPFRRHPLGFLSCTLLSEGSRRLRLHYWPVAGAFQQSGDCQIHDHLFDFKSWVLGGLIENIEYTASPTGVEHALYEASYVGDTSVLEKTKATVRLQETRRQSFSAGEPYSVSAGVLHQTVRRGDKPAITVLVTDDRSPSAPLVIGPLNGENRYSYVREPVSEQSIEAMLAGYHLCATELDPKIELGAISKQL